jgi:hypothetical protein
MDNATFKQFDGLTDKWLAEAKAIGENAKTLEETTKARTLIACAHDVTQTLHILCLATK